MFRIDVTATSILFRESILSIALRGSTMPENFNLEVWLVQKAPTGGSHWETSPEAMEGNRHKDLGITNGKAIQISNISVDFQFVLMRIREKGATEEWYLVFRKREDGTCGIYEMWHFEVKAEQTTAAA